MKIHTALPHALCIAGIAFLPTACKKEIKEPGYATASKPVLCTEWGNTWVKDITYKEINYYNANETQSLVYNNRHYFFDKRRLLIYDGSHRDTITSAAPNKKFNFGFTLGNKGYLGNIDPDNPADNFFGEYDFAANTWVLKANFPGLKRYGAAYFSIGNKGYLTSGGFENNSGTQNLKDTWEYNPLTNTWTQKASLPGAFSGRIFATGFNIGNKGYIVNGSAYFSSPDIHIYFKHLLEYDPVTDSWSYKADFPGKERIACVVFVINGDAYIGGGHNFNHPESPGGVYNTFVQGDLYKYSAATNSWAFIPGSPWGRWHFGYSINSYGYVVMWGLHDAHKYTPKTCVTNPAD